MEAIRTHIDKNGRVLIPAFVRSEWNIKPGDVFVIRIIDNEIRMITLNQAVKNAQSLVRKYVPQNISLVEELIQSRRAEVQKEIEEEKSWKQQ